MARDVPPIQPKPGTSWFVELSAHLLNVIVRQCPAILKLLSGEDQTLLVWGNPLLVLYFMSAGARHKSSKTGRGEEERTDLALDIVDGVGRLDLKSDGLARQGLDEAIYQFISFQFPFFGLRLAEPTSAL